MPQRQGVDNAGRMSVHWSLIDEKEPPMSGYESPTPEEETTGESGAGESGAGETSTNGGETGSATGGGSPGDPDAMGADDSLTVEEGGGRPQAVED
jgi:hypothetical protein